LQFPDWTRLVIWRQSGNSPVLQTGNYRELAGRPVGIFHYQSIDSRRVRWESRYSSLRAPLDEAILEEDRELVNRCLLVCRATPISRDISQRQPEQLGRAASRQVV